MLFVNVIPVTTPNREKSIDKLVTSLIYHNLHINTKDQVKDNFFTFTALPTLMDYRINGSVKSLGLSSGLQALK